MAQEGDYLAARVQALNGGAPPKDILARSGLHKFYERLKARHDARAAQGRENAERIAKIRAPQIASLAKDRVYAETLEAFRKHGRPKLSKALPHAPLVKDDVRSGSIITVFGPPFDVLVGWAEGPGGPLHTANPDGSFEVGAFGGGGYTSAVAGVGKWFNPLKDGVLRAASFTPFNWAYGAYANFETAHSDGYFGWWIWDATEQTEAYVSFNQIFSVGASWLDSISGDGSGYFQEQPLVLLKGGHWYEIVPYCEVMVDDGFSSSALGEMNGATRFFVFEQYI